jgi:hypothetical protein
MPRHNKTERITVRVSPEQRSRLAAAAKAESKRRGELIEPSQLLREGGMARVDEILAAAA